jgi:hypothetical protein
MSEPENRQRAWHAAMLKSRPQILQPDTLPGGVTARTANTNADRVVNQIQAWIIPLQVMQQQPAAGNPNRLP